MEIITEKASVRNRRGAYQFLAEVESGGLKGDVKFKYAAQKK